MKNKIIYILLLLTGVYFLTATAGNTLFAYNYNSQKQNYDYSEKSEFVGKMKNELNNLTNMLDRLESESLSFDGTYPAVIQTLRSQAKILNSEINDAQNADPDTWNATKNYLKESLEAYKNGIGRLCMSDSGIGDSTGPTTGAGTESGMGIGPDPGTEENNGLGPAPGSGVDGGTGTAPDTGTGNGTGTSPDTGMGTGPDTGTGSDSGLGTSPGTGTGNDGLGTSPGTGTGDGSTVTPPSGTGAGNGSGMGTGTDSGTGTGTGTGSGTDAGGVGTGSGIGGGM